MRWVAEFAVALDRLSMHVVYDQQLKLQEPSEVLAAGLSCRLALILVSPLFLHTSTYAGRLGHGWAFEELQLLCRNQPRIITVLMSGAACFDDFPMLDVRQRPPGVAALDTYNLIQRLGQGELQYGQAPADVKCFGLAATTVDMLDDSELQDAIRQYQREMRSETSRVIVEHEVRRFSDESVKVELERLSSLLPDISSFNALAKFAIANNLEYWQLEELAGGAAAARPPWIIATFAKLGLVRLS